MVYCVESFLYIYKNYTIDKVVIYVKRLNVCGLKQGREYAMELSKAGLTVSQKIIVLKILIELSVYYSFKNLG